MDGYLSTNLYIRPCCGDCQFKGIPRKSDVTFADFWGIDKEFDDDKGTSMLLINSDKGREYFDKVKGGMEIHQKDFNSIFDGNAMFSSSVNVPLKAHDFLADLDNMSFSKCLDKYKVHVPLWRRIARKAKRVIKKLLGK